MAFAARSNSARRRLIDTAEFRKSYLFELYRGNLLADLMREGTGADIAFMNAGGIRSDLPAGGTFFPARGEKGRRESPRPAAAGKGWPKAG